MNRPLIYLISLIIFFDGNVVTQLVKLPKLVDHFVEHKTLDHKVSFISFLSMHYWGKDINDKDQDKDLSLPFKTSSNQNAIQFVMDVPVHLVTKFKFIYFPNQWSEQLNLSLPHSFLSILFRPPR